MKWLREKSRRGAACGCRAHAETSIRTPPLEGQARCHSHYLPQDNNCGAQSSGLKQHHWIHLSHTTHKWLISHRRGVSIGIVGIHDTTSAPSALHCCQSSTSRRFTALRMHKCHQAPAGRGKMISPFPAVTGKFQRHSLDEPSRMSEPSVPS